ncbi:MAG: flagellar basal body-associated FliL family protein [Alphaproteobacteria bacterium]|nr:flagellar basal body-associated FliL family protein [Alphaproteobacteria bacterium]
MKFLKALSLLCFLAMLTFPAFAASEEKKDSNGIEYVEMEPLILPVIDEDGVYQVLSMVVVIEVNGIYNADKVKAKKPKLKDAYIQDMYGVLNEHAALKGGILQVGIIKKRLNSVTNSVINDKDIETDVLLQVVQQQPI